MNKAVLSYIKPLWPLLLLIAAGLAAAAAWDLDISRALYAPAAGWAIFIEKYGETPGLFLSAWALLLLNAGLSGGRLRRIALGVFNFIVCDLLLEYALFKIICGRLNIRTVAEMATFAAGPVRLIRLVTAPVVLAAMLLFKYRLKDFALRHNAFARIVIAQLAISQLMVQSFKGLWGRVRFRDLAPGFADFSPWYLPQHAGGSSFPSGHTALAWMLLPAFLLCGNSPVLRRLALGLSIIWGITVGLGRITMGAHYTSDVLFASLLTITPFLLLLRRQGLPPVFGIDLNGGKL